MGLALHYVLSPRSTNADIEARAVADQQIMGLAIKTLHDNPILTDQTKIATTGGPQPVFPPGLTPENRLRLHLLPIPAHDAPQSWQAGTNPLRLPAYYEVSATLLEPEELRPRATRVLTLGLQTFVGGTPRIFSSRNSITFTQPFEPQPHELEL